MLPDLSMLDIATRAVGIGADMLVGARPKTVRLKGDRDYVTDLDVAIEERIRSELEAATPGFSFLGEETAEWRAGGEYRWVLDPIDGTSNFVHGIPLCAVSLALLCGSTTVLAAIAAPFLGQTYRAALGEGAFVDGEVVRASGVEQLSEAVVSIGDYAVGTDAAAKNTERLAVTAALAGHVERVRMLGSAALDLAWVAHGRTDACVILGNKPWDTAAGVLLAREAGAVVNDREGRRHSLGSRTTVGCASPALSTNIADLIADTRT